MLKPKISEIEPFNLNSFVKNTIFCYLDHRCGNHGNETRPILIFAQGDDGSYKGAEISTHRDGIMYSADVHTHGSNIDMDSITSDPYTLLHDWLISIKRDDLLVEMI